MLILSRKRGERIYITPPGGGVEIEIKILDHYKGRTRIGINAPKDCLILREELKLRENQENTET